MNIIANTFIQALKQSPQKAAYFYNNRHTTYKDAFIQVTHVASYLKEEGCDTSSIVGISIEDEILHYIVSLALTLIGARQITIASHDGDELKIRLLELVKPSIVLTDKKGISTTYKTIQISNDYLQLDAIKSELTPLIVTAESYRHHPCGGILLRTSGTTGGLNIVEFNAQDLSIQSSRHPEYVSNSLLRLASIEHNNSKRHRLYAFFNIGTNIFRDKHGDNWLELTSRNLVNILDISRLHIIELLNSIKNDKLENVIIRTGGSAIPLELRQNAMERLTPHFYVRYATTEFGGISMANADMHKIHGNVGIALKGVEIQIVDEEHSVLSEGQIGQIRLKAAGASHKYLYSETKSSSSAKFLNGFFYPGDMGWIHPSGQLIVEGRKDHMMIMNGLNIFPDEIEAALGSIPEISDAACFSFESRQHGCIPVAAVTVKQGTKQTESDLIAIARNKLGLKSPRRILITNEIPLTSAGKHDKQRLKESFLLNRRKV